MKNVLVISSYPAPYRVGVFAALSQQFHLDTYFDTCKNEDRNKKWFCKSGEFTFKLLDNPKTKREFKESIRDIKKYDFVVAYDPARKPAMEAILQCRIHEVPYFVNNDGAFLKKNFLKDLLKRFLFGGASGCFAAGKSSCEYFQYYGVEKSRIFLHKFSSLYEKDILKQPILHEERIAKRKILGLKEMPTVISVGQFIKRKGFDVLIDAWKKIDDSAQLLIIGGGGEKEKYEEMINIFGLNNIHIIDFIAKEELFEYYKASDLFVLPTREDVWGLVVNEAMAIGLPIITTDKCNAGLELIENGKNGFIVPVEDANSLEEKMMLLLQSSELRDNMAHSNLEKIREYTIEEIAKSHIHTIYTTLNL